MNILIWSFHWNVCSGFVLCVRVLTKNKHVDLTVGASGNLSDRTPRRRRGGKETNYWKLVSNIYSLYFVLTGTVAKQSVWCVQMRCVNNAQTYHSETLLSRRDSQTRTNLASVWGPMKQIKALNGVCFCRPDPSVLLHHIPLHKLLQNTAINNTSSAW